MLLISELGFVPLRLAGSGLPTYMDVWHSEVPRGRLGPGDLADHEALKGGRNSPHQGRGWNVPRLMSADADAFEAQRRTRGGGEQGRREGDGLALGYCGGFSVDVKKCVCPLLGSHIEIIQVGRGPNAGLGSGGAPTVTLITVVWADEFYSSMLDPMLDSWDGPKVGR